MSISPLAAAGHTAPDLAVEVISPNDLYTDVEEKVVDFLAAGTGMVLVANPCANIRSRKAIVRHYFEDFFN